MSAATLTPTAAERDLQTLLDQHNGVLFTMDPIEDVTAWYGFVDGRLVVLAPEGQNPATTLERARSYLNRTGRAA